MLRALALGCAVALVCQAQAAKVDDAGSRKLLAEAQAALAHGDYPAAEAASKRLLQENIRVFGPGHQNVGTAYSLLGASYLRQGRYGEAETQFRRALAIYEKRLGPDHVYTAAALNSLALVLEKLGDYAGAEALLRRSLAILEKKLGKENPDTATTLSNLGRVLELQGKFAGVGAEQGDGGTARRLAARAERAVRRGEFREAETLQHEVVAIHERTLGPDNPTTATSLSNLGNVLYLQGKYAEAEKVYRRALAVREKVLGPDHPDVATSLNNLANALQQLGEGQQIDIGEARARASVGSGLAPLTEVEAMYRRALAIQERALGPDHPSTANTLNNLGVMLSLRGDFAQAEKMHRAALATMEKVYGEQHPDTAAVLTALSYSLDRQGKVREAEASYERAVEISRKTGNPRSLLINASRLGYSLAKRGRYREALPYYKEAVQTLDFLYSQTRGYSEETRQTFLSQFSAIYRETIHLLVLLQRTHPAGGYDREALAIASRNQSRIFTEMMRQADVARFSRDPAFIALRERREQLQASLARERQGRATVPITLADAAQRVADYDAQIAQTSKGLAEVEARLWREYPRFMELANPRPVTVEELQKRLLRPGEALLAYVLLPQETVIFAVTAHKFRMTVSPAKRADVAARVHRIRRAIGKVAVGESVLFLRDIDPELLNSLYRDLVAPVAQTIAGHDKVFVVADGPLLTIPFEFMVTEYDSSERDRFEAAQDASDGSVERPFLGEYRALSYLGGRFRFAYLPSLSALASQRLYPRGAAADKLELVAFADPLFAPTDGQAMPARTLSALARLNVHFRRTPGGLPLIPRLAETADEAKQIAGVLGGRNELFLGRRAQESVVKSTDLRDARFVLFATHGFLGGSFIPSDLPVAEGETRRVPPPTQAQPALALTLVGDLKGEDGLLTMKEVIEDLQLNADLVALSACNTAGDTAEANNGEGFAGLTRAFMYAGAKSLLVSHWSVDSASTLSLMTTTFRNVEAGMPPLAAVSDAQRRLIAGAYANGPYHFSRAHPFFWAPFVYVGD